MKNEGKACWQFDLNISWLKFFSAMLMVAAASYVPTILKEDVSYSSAFIAVFSAMGGALLADAFVTSRRFVKSISPRLNAINQLLATVTQQISSIALEEQVKAEENQPIDKISVLIPTLRAIITDISNITENKFTPTQVNETKLALGELITELENPEGNKPQDQQKIISSLKVLYSSLSNGDELSLEKVTCPYENCQKQVEISLGASPPASQVVSCVDCGNKYHVHRVRKGGVKVKQWGSNKRT